MSKRNRRRRREKRSIHNPAVPITSKIVEQYLGLSGTSSAAGAKVSWRTALQVGAVWQAVNLISGDIAQLPFVTYRPTSDKRGEERAIGHPVYRLLLRHTGEMTSNLWLVRMLAQAALFGNAYSYIVRRGSTPVGLHWLHRDQVQPDWRDGVYYYLVQWDGNKDGKTGLERVPAIDIFHLPGLTLDEFGGLSLIDYARNTIGREIATETYGDDFFKNGAVPAGWFEYPGELSEEAQKRFMNSVEQRHRGDGKRHKLGLLEEGMKWVSAGVSPEDALLVDMMAWGVKDVARFFNLPPHKLGDDSRVNYNSLEQENKAYYSSSLGQWITRVEAEANYKLFTEEEFDSGMAARFAIDAFNKADTTSRYSAYAIAVQWGIMSRNEVRDREGLNPYDGGDEYLTPATHTTGEPADDESPADDELTQAPPADETTRAAVYDLLRENMEAAARLLANASTRAAKKSTNFLGQLNGFEARFRSAVEGKIGPALIAAAGPPAAEVTTRILAELSSRMLAAAECPPESLGTRVADAGEGVRVFCAGLAREIVFGRVAI